MVKIEVELEELKQFLTEFNIVLEQEGEIVGQLGKLCGELSKNAEKQLELIKRFFEILGIPKNE